MWRILSPCAGPVLNANDIDRGIRGRGGIVVDDGPPVPGQEIGVAVDLDAFGVEVDESGDPLTVRVGTGDLPEVGQVTGRRLIRSQDAAEAHHLVARAGTTGIGLFTALVQVVGPGLRQFDGRS